MLVGLGLLGALGLGAFLLFSNQNTASDGGAGSGAGGGAPLMKSDPGTVNYNYNVNIGAPGFPDLSGFFQDTNPFGGSSGGSSGTAAKKSTSSPGSVIPVVAGPSQALQGGTITNAPRAQPYGFNFLSQPKVI